jgi:hypothetical protein
MSIIGGSLDDECCPPGGRDGIVLCEVVGFFEPKRAGEEEAGRDERHEEGTEHRRNGPRGPSARLRKTKRHQPVTAV